MMIYLKAFAVRDTKAESFPRPPFFTQATGQAVRAFADACQDKDTEIGQHPADFTLFEIGIFDQVTGTLIPRKEGILDLGNGLAFTTTTPTELAQ